MRKGGKVKMPNTDNNISINKRTSVRKQSAPRNNVNGNGMQMNQGGNSVPKQNAAPAQNAKQYTRQENAQRQQIVNEEANNTANNTQNNQPRRDPSKNLKKMQYGVTKIASIEGKVNGTFQNMSLFYGNVTNYKSDDGIPKRVNEEFYNKKLEEFLDSEEGQDYEVPSEDDRAAAVTYIKNYISNTRKEAERRAIEEQVQARLREEDEKRVAKLYGHEDGDDDENLYSEPEYPQNDEPSDQYEDDSNENEREPEQQIQETYDEDDEPTYDEPEETAYAEPVKPQNFFNRGNNRVQFDTPVDDRADRSTARQETGNKKLLVVMSVLMALNLIATVLMGVLGPRLFKQSLSKMNMGELNVNGDVYTIPLSTIDVGDGETKTVFYALTTKNEDGEITNEAYPIGEWVVKGSGLVKESKLEEPTAAQEETAESAESEEKGSEEQAADTATDEEAATGDETETDEVSGGEGTTENSDVNTDGSAETAEQATE